MSEETPNVDESQKPTETQGEAAQTPAETIETQGEAPDKPGEDAKLPDYGFAVEDCGTLKKKVCDTVPEARIEAKLNEMFGELSETAQVPGFRVGHAPRRLIEKRFGKEISNDVRNALVGDALGKVSEKAKLMVIGDPDLKLDEITLPEKGDMSFSFEVEVAPDFELPQLKGIKVNRPVIKIDDARVDEALDNIRRSQAKHEVTQDAAVEGDIVLAGSKISGEGLEPHEHHGLVIRVAPGQVEDLPLLELGTELAGKKAGDTVTIKVTAPQAHPNEAWRGKELTVELTISEVRHTVLPEVNEEFAVAMGFENLSQLRQQVSVRLQARVAMETQQAMRTQICKYLLDNVKFDLPQGVVERHAKGLLTRRYIDLMYQGVPKEKIDEHLAQMQASIGEQAALDLRLSFMLGKVAEQEKIDVTEGEINARVAAMAQQNNRRPERMRQDMDADGSLTNLVDSLREEKALDKLLEDAEISEVTPEVEAKASDAEAPKSE